MTGKTTPRRRWAAPPLVQSPRCDLGPCRVSAASAKLNGITMGPAAARRHGRTPCSVGSEPIGTHSSSERFCNRKQCGAELECPRKRTLAKRSSWMENASRMLPLNPAHSFTAGVMRFLLRGCHFINPKFVFDGAAANTLLLLRGLYADGFQAVVETSLSPRSGTSNLTRH